MNTQFRFLALLVLMSISALESTAQILIARIQTGYTFGSKFTIDGGQARIRDGSSWSGGLAYFIDESKGGELFYNYQSTFISARSSLIAGGKFEEQLNIHYIMAGVIGKRDISSKVDVMGGVKIGAVIFDPVQSNYSPITRMAVGFNGGGTFYLTEKVGLNAGLNLLMPIFDINGFVWWSPGSGINVGLSSNTPLVQFSFVTGLSFRL